MENKTLTAKDRAMLNSAIKLSRDEFSLIRAGLTLIETVFIGDWEPVIGKGEPASVAEILFYKNKRWSNDHWNKVHYYVRYEDDWMLWRVEDLGQIPDILEALKKHFDSERAKDQKAYDRKRKQETINSVN